MEKTIQITLNQTEANLVLRAVEILQDACAAAVEPEEAEILAAVWDKVFDTGIDAGFGSMSSEETA